MQGVVLLVRHITVDSRMDVSKVRGPIIRGEPRYAASTKLLVEEYITTLNDLEQLRNPDIITLVQ